MKIDKCWNLYIGWDLGRGKSHKKVLEEDSILGWDLDSYEKIFLPLTKVKKSREL